MTQLRTITLPDHINERLKKESNVSGLIASLLESHYRDNRSDEEIIEEVQEKIKEKKKEEDYKKRQEALNERVRKAILEEAEKGEEIENEAEKTEN